MDTVIIRALRPHEKKRLVRMKRQRANAVNSLHARVLLLSRGRVSNRDITESVFYNRLFAMAGFDFFVANRRVIR